MARALYEKLGIKEHLSISVINPPLEFDNLFEDVPFNLKWIPPYRGVNYIHFFPKNLAELEEGLPKYQNVVDKDGMIWVS